MFYIIFILFTRSKSRQMTEGERGEIGKKSRTHSKTTIIFFRMGDTMNKFNFFSYSFIFKMFGTYDIFTVCFIKY